MAHTFFLHLAWGMNIGNLVEMWEAKCSLNHKAKSLVYNVQGSQQITGRAP